MIVVARYLESISKNGSSRHLQGYEIFTEDNLPDGDIWYDTKFNKMKWEDTKEPKDFRGSNDFTAYYSYDRTLNHFKRSKEATYIKNIGLEITQEEAEVFHKFGLLIDDSNNSNPNSIIFA